jgi:hypothetical protein
VIFNSTAQNHEGIQISHIGFTTLPNRPWPSGDIDVSWGVTAFAASYEPCKLLIASVFANCKAELEAKAVKTFQGINPVNGQNMPGWYERRLSTRQTPYGQEEFIIRVAKIA